MFWKGKLSIPSHSTIKKITLEEFHDSPVGGHAGFPRTLANVSTQFCGNPILWQGVNKDVKQYMRSCLC